MHSGVDPSFHQDCHYHITLSKFNLEIYYHSPHERLVWHYQPEVKLKSMQDDGLFKTCHLLFDLNQSDLHLYLRTIKSCYVIFVPTL